MKNTQHIGCRVSSCKHNCDARECELERIEVAPRCGCNTGDPAEESMCASYQCKR